MNSTFSTASVALSLICLLFTTSSVSAREGVTVMTFREKDPGTSWRWLRAAEWNTCYLSGMSVAETDSRSESAACQVYVAPKRTYTYFGGSRSWYTQPFWRLDARIGAGKDETVTCWATCFADK